MEPRKRILLLILILFSIVVVVETITIGILYHSTIAEEKLRLQESVKSQARLIEAIARFDKSYNSNYPYGARQATLTQIQDAHSHYQGFGKTGEFTLSTKENNQIIFLLNHRHHDLNNLHPIPWDSKNAEPMRLALSGKQGVIIGLDYRGEKVLAAYEPVAELNLGIVAKIDLSEVRAPYIKASFISGLFAIMVIGLGVFLFFKITNPLLHGLQDQVIQLAEGEERLREIFKFMKGGGGVYKAVDDGNDFIIVDFCRPDHKDLITNNENLIGKRILDVFPASKEHGLLEVFQQVWKTGISKHHSVTIFNDEEITGWRENYIYKLSSGEIVALYEDITEKKQMEMAILDSERLFRTIFETSPEPINMNRLHDGKFIIANDVFFNFTGFKYDEVIGKTALEINIWDDLDQREKFFTKFFDRGTVRNFEAQFRRKDGNVMTAQVSATMLNYHDEPHLLAVTRDITELKNTEKSLFKVHQELEKRYEITTDKLIESEIKYFTLVEALLTGVYMCLGDKLVFVNKQISEIFGYGKDELLGMNLLDLIYPKDREMFSAVLTKVLNWKNEESEFEVRGVTKNGDIVYLMGRNTRIDYIGQKAILGNIADISTRKLAEDAKDKSEKELKVLSTQLLSAEEKERKRIAGDIHDSVGQALSAIKFSVENSLNFLTEKSLQSAGDTLKSIVPLTQQTIEEVRRIVMDLRPSILDDLGLKATITWFCREFRAVYTGIYIEQEIHFEENNIIVPLKTVIYRIMQEAFNNAAKHSNTESILLRIEMTKDNLELLIEDKGIGFDVKSVELMANDKRGVGLASMRERALLSGGVFDIVSSSSAGTRIQVSWPASATYLKQNQKNDRMG